MLLIRLVFRIRDVLWKRLIVNVIVVVMKGIYGMILDVLLRGKSVVSVMKLDILNDKIKNWSVKGKYGRVYNIIE